MNKELELKPGMIIEFKYTNENGDKFAICLPNSSTGELFFYNFDWSTNAQKKEDIIRTFYKKRGYGYGYVISRINVVLNNLELIWEKTHETV